MVLSRRFDALYLIGRKLMIQKRITLCVVYYQRRGINMALLGEL